MLIIDALKNKKRLSLKITNLKFEIDDLVKIIENIHKIHEIILSFRSNPEYENHDSLYRLECNFEYELEYSLPSNTCVFVIGSKNFPYKMNPKNLRETIEKAFGL